jgi:hypothetical protein
MSGPGRKSFANLCLAALLLSFGASALAAETDVRFLRLDRGIFDVIPPDERVRGERGTMAVWQDGCRVGPTEWSRRRIVDIAVQEWGFFGLQIIDNATIETRLLPQGIIADRLNPEIGPHIPTIYPRMGESEGSGDVTASIAGYWSATPDGADVLAQQNRAWSGAGRNAVGWIQPWSAAFISWVMCESGLGDRQQFERDISHRVYVDQAIRARDGQAPNAAYVAYDTAEQQIVPGDLLCNARGGADYQRLADRRLEMGNFAPTHCDIVVKIDEEAERILAIGGNVSQSVTLTILRATRDARGILAPVSEEAIDGATTMFAHLKLRAEPIEANALENTPTVKIFSDPRVLQALKGDTGAAR